MPCSYHILLTVDVEDWFQVENLRTCCPTSSWPSFELRVEKNVHRLLDLLDEASLKRSAISDQLFKVENKSNESCKSCQESIRQDQQDEQEVSSAFPDEKQKDLARAKRATGRFPIENTFSQFHPETEKRSGKSCKSCLTTSSPRIRATFFVLGWIAERLPDLVREIQARGHEVASHGYHHDLCSQISYLELWRDIRDSKKLIEDIIGARVYGYRAPNFSISDDILKMIADTGYLYDSSFNSFSMHSRYGKISLNGQERRGIAYKISEGFHELAISNLKIRNFVLPWGGGAYFRLIPAPLFRIGVREILKRQHGYLFYMHPWEVDPEQPRPEGTSLFSRFKHYTNLSGTEGRLWSFLLKFSECRFVSCHEHLQTQ